MLIKNCLLATLLTGLLCLNAQASYTQMIVDNNNRVMPIFFHNTPAPLPLIQPDRFQPVPVAPVVLPARPQPQITHPVIREPLQPRNPLTGPYFISPERHSLMAVAHSALGIPYIYGGNNPQRGLDCSSLMQFIHQKALGVRLPRTAAQQRDRSRTISFNNLQPGDLLFFKIDRRNNHVGLYIGNGQFIHASSSNKRASIASMNRKYWQKRFVKFGSYLGS